MIFSPHHLHWRGMKILPAFLALLIFVFFFTGCTKTDQNQPPSNREETPTTGRDDRADKPAEGQQPPTGTPRAPKGEVKRNEYTVQVGIFNRAEDADQLAYELRAQRVNNFVQSVGKQWRVCVGRYYSEARATRMANQLKGMGFTDSKVIAPGN